VYGYHTQVGGRFSGDLLIGRLEDIHKNPDQVPRLFRVRGAKLKLKQAAIANLPVLAAPEPARSSFEPVPAAAPPTVTSVAEQTRRDREEVGIKTERPRASSKPPHIWTEDWNALSYVRRLELGREYAEEQEVAQERSVAPGLGGGCRRERNPSCRTMCV
jgi:hypothetical protein